VRAEQGTVMAAERSPDQNSDQGPEHDLDLAGYQAGTREEEASSRPDPTRRPAPAGGSRGLILAGASYLVLAIGLWWGVWSSHPTSTATCGCGDAARFLWFTEWPAYALTHGHSLLWSSWLFHPTGINLLDDTSVLALGIVLAPLTLAAGPVLAMNVGLTLAPALSALAMYLLLRRWVAWAPAAWLGGLAYGFSPFMVTELALNQTNIAFLVVPPLLVMVLEDLFVTQRRPPWRTGLALAILVIVQFFLSTEVLLISAIAAALGTALLVAWTWTHRPDDVRTRFPHAWRSAAIGVGVSIVVLAYPLWFVLAGPAHLSGPIWSLGATSHFGTTPSSFVSPSGLEALRPGMLRLGGYQGPVLAGFGTVGLGILALALLGVVLGRGDRRRWLFGALGGVMVVVSLAPGRGVWVPWAALQHIPWVGDIVEVRFVFVVTLCVAILAGLAADGAADWLDQHGPSRHGPLEHGSSQHGSSRRRSLLAWPLIVLAVTPTVIVLGPNLPLTVRPVVLPEWFSQVGPTLPAGQVVLTYPMPSSGLQASQAWQAVNGMVWAQASGGGPGGQAFRTAPGARAGFEVLVAASLPLAAAPLPTPASLAAVRSALAAWQVTTVVVPVQEDLPLTEQGRSTAYAVGFMTAALGRAPTLSHRAFVWSDVASAPAATPVASRQFADCTDMAMPVRMVPSCILDGQ
jgi:hypothetical protein